MRRDVGREPLPADVWTTAVGRRRDAGGPSARPSSARRSPWSPSWPTRSWPPTRWSSRSPLYNFGIAAHLKAWVDVLITDPRFAPGNQPLAGRPVALVVSRGGGYGPGTPREGWDHGTGWLVRILGDVWGGDVT